MAFNHYAKIARIINSLASSWIVVRIDKPTTAKKFNGGQAYYDHYYRVYDGQHRPIPYCKFQQIERFARVMQLDINEIPVVDEGALTAIKMNRSSDD